MATKRILYLHESALSHAEYTHYVASFKDLVEGDRSQNPSVSVPEARGWLKGRYAANNTVDAATIDKILRLFYPQLAPTESFTAGQFYAVLRLIVHVQNGKEVDDSLVFSQPENWPRKSPPIPPRSLSSAQSHETRRRSPPPPLPPKRSAPTTPKTVQTDLISVSSAASEPPSTPAFHSNNPFANRATSAPNSAKPTLNGSTFSSDEGSIPDTTTRASSSPTRSPNPFINRAKSISKTKPAIPVPIPSPSLSIAGSTPVPPLPPRRSSILPPPRHVSQQAGAIPTPNTNPVGSPPKPPKPPMPFPVSPLIKQGLLAAKGAQMKSEMSLDKLRTWEVIKTGGVDGPPSKQRSISPRSNATGRIRSTTMQRTVKSEDGRFAHSAGEYEDGDRASMSTSSNTNTSGPESCSGVSRSGVISPSGSATRLGRSRSLHQPGGAALPVPPPRRRRPESVQLASPSTEAIAQPTATTTFTTATAPALSSAASGFSTFGRRGSHSHGIDSLHKAVANMRPGFESARAKVEGKLIPGGYGRWREERLVDDGEEESGGYAPVPPSSINANANANANTNTNFGGRGRSENRQVYGSDAEEEGVEDGWRPLRG